MRTSSEGLDKWATHMKSFGLGNYLGYDLSIGKKDLFQNQIIIIDFMAPIDGDLQQQFQILLAKGDSNYSHSDGKLCNCNC
ncbi:MAG: hypothetical protein CM15mP102_17890 [Flavobacteriales bacterium]|nr:MAG: hypothetical protein CM15mP102_17890 [Flavobacteriales bacterium]